MTDFGDLEIWITQQLSDNRPFVCYKKPNDTQIHILGQSDNQTYIADENSDGFVLYPYQEKHQQPLVIPYAKATSYKIDCTELPEECGYSKIEPQIHSNKQSYIDTVQTFLDSREGLKKVVLSHCLEFEMIENNPLNNFVNLIYHYSDQFVSLWYHPQSDFWMGSTPERLIQIKDAQFEIMSLAATVLDNGKIPQWSYKELEEQQMVTDSIYKQIALYTSEIKTSDIHNVRAGNLWHLQSIITGKLQKTRQYQLVKSLHPTPAVCGHPEQEAKAYITQNENHNRMFYTGFLGEYSPTSTDLYVNIRCAQMANDLLRVFVGAGITKLSRADDEWKEIINKSKTILKIFELN